MLLPRSLVVSRDHYWINELPFIRGTGRATRACRPDPALRRDVRFLRALDAVRPPGRARRRSASLRPARGPAWDSAPRPPSRARVDRLADLVRARDRDRARAPHVAVARRIAHRPLPRRS